MSYLHQLRRDGTAAGAGGGEAARRKPPRTGPAGPPSPPVISQVRSCSPTWPVVRRTFDRSSDHIMQTYRCRRETKVPPKKLATVQKSSRTTTTTTSSSSSSSCSDSSTPPSTHCCSSSRLWGTGCCGLRGRDGSSAGQSTGDEGAGWTVRVRTNAHTDRRANKITLTTTITRLCSRRFSQRSL